MPPVDLQKLLAFFLAFALPTLYITAFLQDQHLREVRYRSVALALFMGFLSAALVVIFKLIFFPQALAPLANEVLSVTLFVSFIEAGLLEELAKNMLFLLCLSVTWLHTSLGLRNNTQVLFLAILIGLGFAITENILYAFELQQNEAMTILQRSYTTLPLHMLACMLFAHFYLRGRPIALCLLASIGCHALYDFFALPQTLLGVILLRAWLLLIFAYCLWAWLYHSQRSARGCIHIETLQGKTEREKEQE